MMDRPETIPLFMDKVKPQHFIAPVLSKIYVYMQTNYQHKDNQVSNWIQVELNKSEQTTFNFILNNTTLVTTDDLEKICSNLRADYRKEMALRYVDLLHDRVKTSPDIDQHIGEAISNLEILLHDREDNIIETMAEATDKMLQKFEEKIEGKHSLVKTPFDTLDHILGGGLSRGEFLVISSMSGQGKSMLQGQFMTAFCDQGLRVGVVGLEMEAFEYAGRAISQVAADDNIYCLNQNNFKNPQDLDFEDNFIFDSLKNYSDKVSKKEVFFVKPKIITVEEFKSMCKLLVNKYRCDVVFLDHMLLVSSNFEQPKLVEELSNFMKTFATENNIICAAISQMTRGTDLYNPSISNMAGGRAIEHAATTLLGITKVAPKEEKNIYDDEEEEIDFRRKIVGMKIRDSGGDNFILTSFEGQNARFKEIYPNNWSKAKTKKLHEAGGRLEYGI
jgi:replicative DNA helicase